ncbi:extracellular solute-binding protein [Ruminiclostridium herbifermentans]|uniref:Extracellular solute-binding protein n=1 Tax=Ruminiclostridium herbifermentans TaxID=2488810 RepID=A0A4U7JF23_9FIRM|nr:extracellular solute-binding protein [Ruminiclostridium herbifermentans]QNU67767.1 extracellular solute-binding protein [Ruminiclostridium herbifermentans]
MRKKICLIFLAMLLVFTCGCNEKSQDTILDSQSNTSVKQFTETQLKNQIPEGYTIEKILKETSDGFYTLCFNFNKPNELHDHKDETQNNHNDEIHKRNGIFFISKDKNKTIWTGNCEAAAMDSNNQFYILREEERENAKEFILYKYDEHLNVDDTLMLKSPPKEHSVRVNDIFVYSDRIAIIRTGGLQIFNLTGKLLFEKSYKNINNYTSDDSNLYLTEWPVYGGDTNRLFQFDVFELKEKWSADIQLIQDQIKGLSYNTYDSSLYLILNNQLMSCNKGKLSKVCNFLDYKSGKLISNAIVSNDEAHFTSYQQLLFQNKDSFLLLLYSIENNLMFSYSPASKQEVTQPENLVKVLLPTRNNTLEMVAARFEDKNADTKIRFDYFKEIGDLSQPDFIQFMNLKVLSGEQNWDIVPIIFLPYWQYIQKGVLADLDSLDKNHELSNSDKYYVNLIDGCRINNKLYYLPICITFPSFILDTTNKNADMIIQKSKAWTWAELEREISSWQKDSKPFIKNPLYNDTVISTMIYQPYISAFFTGEKKELDVKLFEECMTFLSSFEKAGLYAEKNQVGELMPSLETHWSMFRDGLIPFSENIRVIPVPTLEASKRQAFNIQEAYAINSHSSNPTEAFEFLKFLAQDSSWGYPGAIVKSDREYIIDSLANQLQTSSEKIIPFVDSFLAAKSSLNHANYFDQQAARIVSEIVEQFKKGLISKEEAANDISQRVWLYANE